MNKKFWFVVVVWVALMIRATFAQGAIRGSLFSFTPDGSKLVVYSEGKIEIWQLPDLNLIKSFPVATASDLSADNKFVYVAGVATSVNEHTGTVQVWDLDTGSLAREFNPCSGFAWCGPWTLSAHVLRGAVVVSLVDNSALRYRANSPSEASAYPDGVGIVIFDLNSGVQMNVFDVSDLITNALLQVRNPKFSQDGISLAAQVPVNGGGNGIIVWDISSGKRIATVKTGSINYAISPDAQTLAVNEADYSKEQPRYEIHLISIKSGEVTTIPDFGSGQGIEFSSDGKLLAVAYSDGSIRLWDTVTGKNISTQTGTESYTFNGKIAFRPDSSSFIYGKFDGTIILAKVGEAPTLPKDVVRTLDQGDYQIDLIFDPGGCLLLNGHDLIVRELKRELDVLDSKSNNVDVYAEILQYFAPTPFVGQVESLRQQVEGMMLEINPQCTSEYFLYRVGDKQRGTRFVDSSGLGNIAYGYFATLFTAPQWSQDIIADIAQRFNRGTWAEAFRQCGFDFDCFVFSITVVGDNPDDRRQRFVGEQMARSSLPLTVDLFIRYSNTYKLY